MIKMCLLLFVVLGCVETTSESSESMRTGTADDSDLDTPELEATAAAGTRICSYYCACHDKTSTGDYPLRVEEGTGEASCETFCGPGGLQEWRRLPDSCTSRTAEAAE